MGRQIRRSGIRQPDAFLALLCAIVGLASSKVAMASNEASFQDWLAENSSRLGFQVLEKAPVRPPGVVEGDLAIKFGKRMSLSEAGSQFQRALTEYCGNFGKQVASSEYRFVGLATGFPNGNKTNFTCSLDGEILVAAGMQVPQGEDGKRYRSSSYTAWLLQAPENLRSSAEYLQVLKAAGYKTKAEIDERERQKAIAATAAAEQQRVANQNAERAEAARLAAERPKKSLVGARICNEQHGYQLIGFTEAFSRDTGKIQVRVVGTSSGVTPGGWTPGIIWDYPDNWRLCE